MQCALLTSARSAAVWLSGCGSSSEGLVLYCAQDREFAEGLFGHFSRTTGLPVIPIFDTEAAKSVSLYARLQEEAHRPRCDVFWNNEILSTIRLQRQRLLQPYDSPRASAFPITARADDHTWHAFAARARVLLVNTELVPVAQRPRGLWDVTERWPGQVALAKPQFGTAATEAACLFEVLGRADAERFYRALRANQVQVVPGNRDVAEGVAYGRFAVGLTDTDDAIEQVALGRPVTIVFPDGDGQPAHPRLGTLFIPNTLAIISNCPHPAAARQLVDFLLSPEVEARLAEGASHQFPLNRSVQASLPAPLSSVRTVKHMAVDFAAAADLWDDVQGFLRNEFARPQ